MDIDIKLIEFGKILNTRHLGKRVRAKITDKITTLELEKDQETKIRIDFSGIEAITQGFADETFGKLLDGIGWQKFKDRLKIKNCSKNLDTIIKYAISKRKNQKYKY